MKFLSTISALLFLTACGDSVLTPGKKTSISKKKDSYTYEYNENGCNTGKKSFDSHDAYCKGLLDDAANNYCARSLRQDAYDANCK